MSKRIIVYPKQFTTLPFPTSVTTDYVVNLQSIMKSGRVFLADLSECGTYLDIPSQAEYPKVQFVPTNLFLKTDLPADGDRFKIFLRVKEGWDVKKPVTPKCKQFVREWENSISGCSYKPGDGTWEWSSNYFKNRDYAHPESNKYHVNFPKEMFSLEITFNLQEINPDTPLDTINSYNIY